ncbi:MAG TPA: endolytic transglycosylase MltG [Amnibacterium sp.]|uniref:endolytic transglycosylase MltG n=1 Tax=Amnibacterium sp. TaxID=1872496 RepID=UPI002F91F98F
MAKTRSGQFDVRADDGRPDEFSVLLAPREIADGSEREPHRHGRGRHRRVWPWIVSAVVVLLLLGGGALAAAYSVHPDQVKSLFGYRNDYTGSGSGTVEFVIKPGDLGSTVADRLAAEDVTKTRAAFYDLLLKSKPEPALQPGTYRLAHHMSAATALAALEDPGHLMVADVLIREGDTVRTILPAIAKATGTPLAELQAAAKDYRSLGVPASAPSLEGYLFPATYRFQPGMSAKAMLTTMVKRMYQSLDAAGVAPADREKVLTLAGLVQKEGNGADDPKVARVFLNRLAKHMMLQSDATVSYGAGGTTVVPTKKQYADKNPYNTDLHYGLPPGPISSPGDVAIHAALHPAKGTWLFFVTVNLETGETVFSTTEAEHEKASARFDAWLAAHPSYAK